MDQKPMYDLETRFVDFAGSAIKFINEISFSKGKDYLSDQLFRSACGAALNFGEAQGSQTRRDFIFKMSIVLKELKESRTTLKICGFLSIKNDKHHKLILDECEQLIAITATIIKNKRS